MRPDSTVVEVARLLDEWPEGTEILLDSVYERVPWIDRGHISAALGLLSSDVMEGRRLLTRGPRRTIGKSSFRTYVRTEVPGSSYKGRSRIVGRKISVERRKGERRGSGQFCPMSANLEEPSAVQQAKQAIDLAIDALAKAEAAILELEKQNEKV